MAIARPPVANAFANTVAGTPSDFWDVPATYDAGFTAPGGVPVKPNLSDINWLMWFATLGVRHAVSRGISPWDATETEYTVGSVVYRPIGKLFMLMGSATTGTAPETDVPNWFPLNVLDRGRYIDYATPAAAWKNYVGQVRAAIDHFGFPNSDIIQWDDAWNDPETGSVINTAGDHSFGRWEFWTDGNGSGGGNLASHNPQYTAGDNNNFRLLGIGSTPAGGRADLQLRPSHVTGVFTDDITVRVDWRFLLPPTARANCTFIMGFTSGFQPSNGITDGAFIYLRPSDTTWQFQSISAGLSSSVDTGVAAGSGLLHRASIILVGANQADDGAPRGIAIIDDASVANVTARLPYTAPGAGSGRPLSPIFAVNTSATASAIDLLIGPVRYRQSV